MRGGKSSNALVATIFCLALGLRIGVAAGFEGLGAPPNAGAQPDQIDYEDLAFRLASGHGYTLPSGAPTFHRPPGTAWTLWPVYALAGRSFTLGRLWFCLLSALTCVAAAWLGRLAFGVEAGLIGGLWLALYPGHFYYSMHFVSEVPYALYVTIAAGCTLRAISRAGSLGGRWSAFAGIFWALAILTRPQMVFLVPLAGGACAILLARGHRRAAAAVAAQAALAIALLVPWVVRNDLVVGRPAIAGVGGYTFWGAHNERVLADPALRGGWVRTSELVDVEHPFGGSEVDRERLAWGYGTEFVRHHLRDLPKLEAAKIVKLLSPFGETTNRAVYWSFALGWLCTAPFVLLGMVAALRDDRPAAVVLLAPLFATLICTLLFYGSGRFRDSVAPLFITLAARGLLFVLSRGPFQQARGLLAGTF